MIGPRPDCMDCKHYDRDNHDGITCKAFPRGIPDNILVEQEKHTKPVKGQSGDYVFEAVELWRIRL